MVCIITDKKNVQQSLFCISHCEMTRVKISVQSEICWSGPTISPNSTYMKQKRYPFRNNCSQFLWEFALSPIICFISCTTLFHTHFRYGLFSLLKILLFLYFNLCLSVMLDSLSCSFTSISYLTTSCSFTLICVQV